MEDTPPATPPPPSYNEVIEHQPPPPSYAETLSRIRSQVPKFQRSISLQAQKVGREFSVKRKSRRGENSGLGTTSGAERSSAGSGSASKKKHASQSLHYPSSSGAVTPAAASVPGNVVRMARDPVRGQTHSARRGYTEDDGGMAHVV